MFIYKVRNVHQGKDWFSNSWKREWISRPMDLWNIDSLLLFVEDDDKSDDKFINSSIF